MVTDPWEFTLLGPVRGSRRGNEARLGSPQQTAVLVALLMRNGAQAGVEELVTGLWGTQAPRTAAGVIRTYACRLQAALGTVSGSRVIAPLAGGYTIPEDAFSTDLARFTELLRTARHSVKAGRPEEADIALRSALALWSGTPLTGLPGPYLAGQRERLRQLRVAALEERITLDIDHGRHHEAIADLVILSAEDPTRERLFELRMRALQRAGHPAEALSTFHQARSVLAAHLGLEPGPALVRLYSEIAGRVRRAVPPAR